MPSDPTPDFSPLQREVMQRRDALREGLTAGRQEGDGAAAADPELPPGADRLWGLALSGGGIRSATFCLGLVQALARAGLLGRLDLLSTVSGGGYAGALVGRLFDRARNAVEARRVETALGEPGVHWTTWWLRANGRYLVPRGVKDITFAAALYLRNLAGVHFELGLMLMLVGALLSLVDLGAWAMLDHWGYTRQGLVFHGLMRDLPAWLPVVWLTLPVVGATGIVMSTAYWCVPRLTQGEQLCLAKFAMPVMLAVLALVLVGWQLRMSFDPQGTHPGMRLEQWLWGIAGSLLISWLIAMSIAALLLALEPAPAPAVQGPGQAPPSLWRRLAHAAYH